MEPRDPEYLRDLVHELRALPSETEWVEFKVDNTNPETIGRNVSALANSAVLNDREAAYIVWGIKDNTHEIVGTNFIPDATKRGNDPLPSWLRRMTSDNVDFRFHHVDIDGLALQILEVAPTVQFPARFKGETFVRVGPVTKKISDEMMIERRLWRLLDRRSFEDGFVATNLTPDKILKMLDYPTYFHLLDRPLPDGIANILEAMRQDRLIARSDAGRWNITNLAAVSLARDLRMFEPLIRKRLRVVKYDGVARFNNAREREFEPGYAVIFQRIIEHIMTLVPSNEVIERALNMDMPMFPEIAVRELVANALIHQDFHAAGTGPIVEIFDDRIEVTNPGQPLVETLRFLDAPPVSRNESIASLMRRFGICEERGSGIDKVVNMIEVHQLPAPLFEVVENSTRCVLFAHKELAEMNQKERVLACYWHACLRYLSGQPTNNRSIRNRFGISDRRSDHASRLLKESVNMGMLIIRNPDAGNKSRSYLPNWASAS